MDGSSSYMAIPDDHKDMHTSPISGVSEKPLTTGVKIETTFNNTQSDNNEGKIHTNYEDEYHDDYDD